MNATRAHLGMSPINPNLVYSYVGNGTRVLVARALGADVTEDLVEQGHRFFLSHYEKHALDNTDLYPGVREMLEQLSGKHDLAILTNKPVSISVEIAEALRMTPYFRAVYGGDSFAAKKPDAIGLLTLMRESHSTPKEMLMVGDSNVDVETARNAGVKSCGVLWGFQPAGLKASNPDLMVQHPEELLNCIL